MGEKVKNMQGRKFGRWTVICETPERTNAGAIKYLCRCDCGNERVVNGASLRAGVSTSCGCYNKDVLGKFGDIVYKEKLYHIWHSMKQRCQNENDKAFANYGARGVTVCADWKNDYLAFKAWALENGYAAGLWLDRIDNDGPYAPWNCRWTTPKRQQRNKRTNIVLSIGGVEKCLSDWADEAGIKVGTLRRRVDLGWPAEHLLDPVETKYSHGDLIKAAITKMPADEQMRMGDA